MKNHQKLPRAGAEREALRERGQFWTPDWVAEAMVAYAVGGGSDHLFDPAVGAGAFFRAAKAVGERSGRRLSLAGTEVFADALDEAREGGLTQDDLCDVQITDFIRNPPEGRFTSIVANPPYIRHHRLSRDLKQYLRTLATSLVGEPLDGRAGLHIYFLLRALERLAPGGRLAFILPADTCEGVFAPVLWKWIGTHYRLDAVITFEHVASPFPGVDTNAVIVLISRSAPVPHLHWARCGERGPSLLRWIETQFGDADSGITACRRPLSEALETGLSRGPSVNVGSHFRLVEFASVLRGIATGANEFFFLTAARAQQLGIPPRFLHPAIGRTRDADGNTLTEERLRELDSEGRPTFLFTPDGRMLESFPARVREYLRKGEEDGLPNRPLISSRRPWYKMENRAVPPFLFAYLGRRNARFIRNSAGVVPLTGFLCVYPRSDQPEYIERLWAVLNHPATVANLALVGKSYGGGAIKVEPRALERLPIPPDVLDQAGLTPPERDLQLAAL